MRAAEKKRCVIVHYLLLILSNGTRNNASTPSRVSQQSRLTRGAAGNASGNRFDLRPLSPVRWYFFSKPHRFSVAAIANSSPTTKPTMPSQRRPILKNQQTYVQPSREKEIATQPDSLAVPLEGSNPSRMPLPLQSP